MKTKIHELRSRWDPSDIASINNFLAMNMLDKIQVPLISIGGVKLRDMRGFVIVEPVEKPSLCRFDFSYCTTRLPGSIVVPLISECRFEGAELNHTNIGDKVTDCNFNDASLKKMYGEYENCSFVNADMTKVSGIMVFRKCDLTGSNWRHATAIDCVFEQCTWGNNRFRSGSFGGSRFIGTHPDLAALGNTIMDGVIFE